MKDLGALLFDFFSLGGNFAGPVLFFSVLCLCVSVCVGVFVLCLVSAPFSFLLFDFRISKMEGYPILFVNLVLFCGKPPVLLAKFKRDYMKLRALYRNLFSDSVGR